MGVMGIKIKIMPESPDTNLEELKNNIKEIIEKQGGKNCQFEEQPIAFGLTAVIAFFAWDEDKELEDLEKELKEIPNVNSAEVIDMRRAFG